jgi:hypothetical protein
MKLIVETGVETKWSWRRSKEDRTVEPELQGGVCKMVVEAAKARAPRRVRRRQAQSIIIGATAKALQGGDAIIEEDSNIAPWHVQQQQSRKNPEGSESTRTTPTGESSHNLSRERILTMEEQIKRGSMRLDPNSYRI